MTPLHHRCGRWTLLAAALAVAGGCALPDPAAQRPACPQAQVRSAACPDGQRLLTYDEHLDLRTYCEAAGSWPRNVAVAGRKDPPVKLKDGVRTFYMGNASWLLFAPEKDPTDTPETVAKWWRQRDCVPPPS